MQRFIVSDFCQKINLFAIWIIGFKETRNKSAEGAKSKSSELLLWSSEQIKFMEANKTPGYVICMVLMLSVTTLNEILTFMHSTVELNFYNLIKLINYIWILN